MTDLTLAAMQYNQQVNDLHSPGINIVTVQFNIELVLSPILRNLSYSDNLRLEGVLLDYNTSTIKD